MTTKHWQDPINLVLGLWLIASPWVLSYDFDRTATWNAVIVGLLTAAAALYALFRIMAWEEWAGVAFGVWMIVSPWVLGFSTVAVATWNAVLVGLAIAALALWVLATDKDLGGWWHPAT